MASNLCPVLGSWVLVLEHYLFSETGFLFKLEFLQMVSVSAHTAGKGLTASLRCHLYTDFYSTASCMY